MIQPKKVRGRPKKSDEVRLIQRTMRMTPAQWRKIDTAGLVDLRVLVDKWVPEVKCLSNVEQTMIVATQI